MSILSHKRRLISTLGNIDGLKILDYGCGAGDFIRLLTSESKPKVIFAVDADGKVNRLVIHDQGDYIADRVK